MIKRFICFVCCLFVFGMIGGCFSTEQRAAMAEGTNTFPLDPAFIAQMTQDETIGAIIYDFDYYSSTKIALSMLKADAKFFLPRIYCYFDDTIGTEIELYNDFTGERLAINEFNSENEDIKISTSYHLLAQAYEIWHHQIWICHFFKHKKYNTFVSETGQRL